MNREIKYIRRRRSRRRTPVFSALLVLFLAVAVSFSAFLSAKYITARKSDTAVRALPFYFESNYLTEGGATYTLQEGVRTISFELYNFADALRYSEVDISATVSLSKGAYTHQTKTVTLTKNTRDTETVSFTDLGEGTYTVTATTGPYSKTLEATFVVTAADNGIDYTVSDSSGSPFLKLEVTSANYDGPVNISWPSGVRPDNTDPLLETASGTSCTVNVTAYSSYTFLFFKDNPTAYYDSDDIKAAKP